ncbi:unnamed protein product, partial [Musa textilis]
SRKERGIFPSPASRVPFPERREGLEVDDLCSDRRWRWRLSEGTGGGSSSPPSPATRPSPPDLRFFRSAHPQLLRCPRSLVLSELGPMGVRSISTQAVRSRMKSVKNIQKITKAMKMVAASKL